MQRSACAGAGRAFASDRLLSVSGLAKAPLAGTELRFDLARCAAGSFVDDLILSATLLYSAPPKILLAADLHQERLAGLACRQQHRSDLSVTWEMPAHARAAHDAPAVFQVFALVDTASAVFRVADVALIVPYRLFVNPRLGCRIDRPAQRMVPDVRIDDCSEVVGDVDALPQRRARGASRVHSSISDDFLRYNLYDHVRTCFPVQSWA